MTKLPLVFTEQNVEQCQMTPSPSTSNEHLDSEIKPTNLGLQATIIFITSIHHYWAQR